MILSFSSTALTLLLKLRQHESHRMHQSLLPKPLQPHGDHNYYQSTCPMKSLTVVRFRKWISLVNSIIII